MASIRIPIETITFELERILTKNGFTLDRATILARVFMENSRDGVASHGLNRFPLFIKHVELGHVNISADPELLISSGALERWDGLKGPGISNALFCADRAVVLARKHGIGCVALRNTNHWMRGGTYGWRAVEQGCAMICWTNTKPNMPYWGSSEYRTGNNPMVLAIPRESGPIVLDMALTQYSYGKLEVLKQKGDLLPFFGGFDKNGNLSKEPAAILEKETGLPIGYWKGSALSLLLDLLAALLSDGRTTQEIGKHDPETVLSQVFIAFDVSNSALYAQAKEAIEESIDELQRSHPVTEGESVVYPGERVLQTRRESIEKGVVVDAATWKTILTM